jgi:hypothetical protein
MGLAMDASGYGMGKRSQRYAAVIEDGVVKALGVVKAKLEAAGKGEAAPAPPPPKKAGEVEVVAEEEEADAKAPPEDAKGGGDR